MPNMKETEIGMIIVDELAQWVVVNKAKGVEKIRQFANQFEIDAEDLIDVIASKTSRYMAIDMKNILERIESEME